MVIKQLANREVNCPNTTSALIKNNFLQSMILLHPWWFDKTDWPLQPFNHDYGLASHTTYVVCVNFIHKSWDLLFNVPNNRFLRHFFMAGLFTLRVYGSNPLRGNRRRNIFFSSHFVLMPDLGYEPWLYVQ